MVMKIFFFKIKESKITRGHNFTLVKKQSRLDVRKFSFSQRTINVWNKLSTECVHASSVNMFVDIDSQCCDYNRVLEKGLGSAMVPLF